MQYWQSVQFPLDDVLRPISPIVYTKLITATFQVVSLQALLKSIVWHIMKLEPLAGPYLANMADASLKSKVFFSPHSFSFKVQVFRESRASEQQVTLEQTIGNAEEKETNNMKIRKIR